MPPACLTGAFVFRCIDMPTVAKVCPAASAVQASHPDVARDAKD